MGVSLTNRLISDTNNSANWDTLSFPLPDGNWVVGSISEDGKTVTLTQKR